MYILYMYQVRQGGNVRSHPLAHNRSYKQISFYDFGWPRYLNADFGQAADVFNLRFCPLTIVADFPLLPK
jgi:hypothetical protein